MSPRNARAAGLLLLVVTVWLVWRAWQSPAPDTSTIASPMRAPAVSGHGDGWPLLPVLVPRSADAGGFTDAEHWPLFGGTPAAVPVPDAAPALAGPASAPRPAEPPPTAPFTVLGSWREDAGRRVILQHGDDSLMVAAGDALPAGWRVQRMERASLVLRHAASGTQQSLDIGDLP